MNDTLKRRLIGLLILLALMFLLSWLLPKNWPESSEQSVSSTVVPLVPSGPYGSPPAPAADSTTQASTAATAAPTVAPAPTSGLPVPVDAVDASAPPMPAASAAPPTSVAPQPPAKTGLKPPILKLTQSLPSAPSPSQAAMQGHKPVAPSLPPPPKLASTIVAPPAPVVGTVPAQARLWYVQIGSFSDRDNAQTTQNLLQNIGYRGESVQTTGASGNVFFRVRLGPFPSEAVAQEAFAKVSHQGYPQARVLSEVAAGKH
jgi:cell division protein FtsN